MQNCFFPPYSISFGLEFCIYVCCMLWNGWEASHHVLACCDKRTFMMELEQMYYCDQMLV